MIDNPASLIDELRWKADQAVVNDFGEHVWLKPLFVDEKFNEVPEGKGKRIGITDCCFVAEPCPRHKQIADQQNADRSQ